MTELSFKGKEFVYNHHLAVPFRPLVPHSRKGIGPVALDGNLVIHGDNLHALKALLPLFAGKVDCIFIDPPYNTGNEGWCYNDNVNAPMIREWLESNPIGIEDGLRHDKWCAMMWPRLQLLHELLDDSGSIWVTVDDNEAHRMKLLLDEIFGTQNFLANFVWQSKDTPGNNSSGVAETHNHLIAFRKSSDFSPELLERNEDQISNYTNPDKDKRGEWLAAPLTRAEHRDRDYYGITNKAGRKVLPPKGSSWRRPPAKMKWLESDNRIWWGKNGDAEFPMEKKFLKEAKPGVVNQTWWPYTFAGSTRNAGAELKEIFGGEKPFETPKPRQLIERVIELACEPQSVILDSFAGSGTTAHAVLAANEKDGGNRRFILVEMEDYADKLTAERVRRVIKGYDFKGTQRTELMRERLNWRVISNAVDLVHKVEAVENLHGHEYDRIRKEVEDGELIVTGEKAFKDRAEGLGGSFTYCTLGEPVELDKVLSGETLPSYKGLGAALFHMATSHALDPAKVRRADFYLGGVEGQHVWLIYKPDLDWLKSPEAALMKVTGKLPASRAEIPFSPRLDGCNRPVPNAVLKVPTGGGKTWLAVSAVSQIMGHYLGRNTGFVLWIVPNEAIYTQTIKRLKDRQHPYRQALDRAAAGRVRIMEKSDRLDARDVDTNLCIMLLMLQSANRETQDSLKMFQDRGDVHGFFPPEGEQQAHKAALDLTPNLSAYVGLFPMVKDSLGNALRIIRPVVVMDEGHRAVSDLAFGTLYGFNPCFVLELTATPQDVQPRGGRSPREGRYANLLVEVTGRELDREGMIKMPLNLDPRQGNDWKASLNAALAKLNSLDAEARCLQANTGRYIRPIMLVQVERTGADQRESGHIHADDVKDWLLTAGFDAAEVAIKTAQQNDLSAPENQDL